MRADHQELLDRLEIPADSPVCWIPMAYRDEHDMSYEAVPLVPVSCCKHYESTCALCVDAWMNDYLVMKVWIEDDSNLARVKRILGMINIPGRTYPGIPDN